jgi:Rps23 Pro-64 3,4-dihydroxylase Tpa1-like proline 4-hydroxylase
MLETISLKNSDKTGTRVESHADITRITQKSNINPHDVKRFQKLKDDFKENAFVEVDGFLSESFAEKCHSFYFKNMPDEWWRAASSPNIDPNESDAKFQRASEDTSETYSNSLKHFNNGSFSYFFHRTVDDHEESCSCGECDIRSFFKSDEMFEFLSDLAGRKLSSESGHFSSWYRKGDFLSAHHDDGNGQVGVVLDFAKNWNPVFGGNLFILEDDWFSCKKVIPPKFNNLKIFDIPKEKKGVPHFVSTVLAEDRPDRKRIAFGGWFK